jgi:hypothetical protein
MEELHPVLEDNGKYTLPTASYNLDLQERRALCTFVREIKVRTGFSVNPKKLVSMKDLSFAHCKAHDCHVMLMVFCRPPTLGSTVHHVSVPGSVADTHRSNKIDIKNYTFIDNGKTHYKVHIT